MEKFEDLIQSPVPVLVDFFAEWCGPCKAMKPILEEVKSKVGDSARIAKIDVDQNEQLAAKYKPCPHSYYSVRGKQCGVIRE